MPESGEFAIEAARAVDRAAQAGFLGVFFFFWGQQQPDAGDQKTARRRRAGRDAFVERGVGIISTAV